MTVPNLKSLKWSKWKIGGDHYQASKPNPPWLRPTCQLSFLSFPWKKIIMMLVYHIVDGDNDGDDDDNDDDDDMPALVFGTP